MKTIWRQNLEKGFTLIEMMAVLALLAILGTVFMNSGYQETKIRNALLTDSEDLSIGVVDMQNRAASFIKGNVSDTVGYGVFIDLDNPSKIETFYKIRDADFDLSEVAGGQKPTSDLIFTNGNHISRICLNSGTGYCYDSSTNAKIALYFVKPKPYTNFAFSSDGLIYSYTVPSTFDSINHVCLEIAPASGTDYRHVDVYYIGQVSSSYGKCQ
jgi:prepilin-type N-terminal cleavage/methylation domain-containing protein